MKQWERFRRILAQEVAHHAHAAGELALSLEESGHAALATEAAFDRCSEDEVAAFVLAHLMISGPHLDDLVEAVQPMWMRVTSKFTPRGGITTDVTVEYKKQ